MEASTEGEPIRWRTDELLAQAGWLGLLARRLVDDPSAADDVVQDTWIAALRRPPERERALRPWLAKVARNIARMQRRGESSRKARESARAEERVSASPDELAARLEGQRMLVAALGELDEPYRSTILLAYFEHLTSEQIAARQWIAAGTVRWRLNVGLDQLRERLDRRHDGDRSAWSLALLPLVRSSSNVALATSTTLPLQGALIMQTLLKVGAAAAAVVLALAGLSVSGVLPVFRERNHNDELATATSVAQPTHAQSESPTRSASEREVAASSPIDAAPVATRTASVDARVFDTEGRPLADAELRTSHRSVSPRSSTYSGSDGRARLDLPVHDGSWREEFEIAAPGFVTHRIQAELGAVAATHLGNVVLAPAGSVSGRTLDTRGAPLTNVLVDLDTLDVPQSELEPWRRRPKHDIDGPQALSDANGRFVLEGVHVGIVRLVASDVEHLATFSVPIEVRAQQETLGVELVLDAIPDDEQITGVVLDPGGQPVPNASIEYEYDSDGNGGGSGSDTSNGRGAFRLRAAKLGRYALAASDRQGRWCSPERVHVESGARDVVLRLQPQPPIEVDVRSRDGRLIEHFTTRASEIEDSVFAPRGFYGTGLTKTRYGGADYYLSLERTGYARGRLGPFHDRLPERLEFMLDALASASVNGRVLANSLLVAGATVRANRALLDRRTERDGFLVRTNPDDLALASSDEFGEFTLALRDFGRYVVRVEANGYAPCELGPLDFDPSIGLANLVAELTSGGAIEGRVRTASARDVAGTIIGFSRGDGHAFTRRVGADGTFRVERLTPGRWFVTQRDEEIGGSVATRRVPVGDEGELPWNCEVTDGATTHFDLDLDGTARAKCSLDIALTLDKRTPGPWRAQLVVQSGSIEDGELASATLDADGRGTLNVNKADRYRLVLTAITGELDGLSSIFNLRLDAGSNSWTKDLRTALVTVENIAPPAHGEQPLALVSAFDDGALAIRMLAPRGGESTLHVAMPAGRARLLRWRDELINVDPLKWPALAEGTLAAGDRITLRAP